MSQPEVLIVGGGLGGLALANGLQKEGISFHVYERDRTENYRAQGYRIRIGGPAVSSLEYLLTPEAMDQFNLSCADLAMHPIPEINAQSAELVEPNVPIPELPSGLTWNEINKHARCVDRAAMREVLIKNIPAQCISYDKVFSHYEEQPEGPVTAFFRDGTSASGSLLIGADGRSSNVRKQLLPDLKLVQSGVTLMYGKTYITPEIRSELNQAMLERMSFVKDRSREDIVISGLEPILFSNAQERQAKGLSKPKDYIFWSLSAPSHAVGFEAGKPAHLSVDESAQKMLEVTEHWHPSVRAMVEHQAPGETSAFDMAIIDQDFGKKTWEPNAHVTVMGDAAHPMAPTGSGAVSALVDARMICEGLVRRKEAEKGVAAGDYKELIGQYEIGMRKFAGEAAPMSWMVMKFVSTMKRGEREVHMGEMAMKNRYKNLQKTAPS